jgi:mono/diheme cytochrome c family protein
LNYPIWQLEMGGGLLIALVAITHVFVSHFAVGGGLFLVLAEKRAYRTGDRAMLEWLKRHSKFFALLTLVFGALTGVGIWFTIGLVHPAATSALIHIFVWGWAIEWTFFVVEIAAAIVYLLTWDKVDRKTHLVFGWIYFWSAFLSLVVINGILTFMFTPGAWLETRTFMDGFLNPTYWPSVVVRTLASVAFAGLYVFATAWREEPGLRVRLARYAAWWALPATIAGPAAAWIYFRVAPGAQAVLLGGDVANTIPRAVHSFRMVVVAALLYAVVLAVVALLAKRSPRVVSLPAAVVLLVLGYASMAGGEYVRESIRKPYVIGNPRTGGYMYVNALTPAEVERTRADGVLAHAKWAAGKDGAPVDELRKGEEVFRVSCRGCHTVDNYGSIRAKVDGKGKGAILGAVKTLDQRYRMPPFPGNDEEAKALALYLASLDGVVEKEAEIAPGDALALGEKVANDFCMSCHSLDDPQNNPLRHAMKHEPALWSSEESAYESIGKLEEINASMSLEFGGTEDERRALAKYLQKLASEN